MNIVVAEALTLAFGPKQILKDAGFAIGDRDCIGLIGANGTGKSTLLQVLAGQRKLDNGALHFYKGATVGYLPQDVAEMPGTSLLQSVLDAAPGSGQLESRLLKVEQALEKATDPEQQTALAGRLSDLHDRKERFEADYSPHEAESILMGLGFRKNWFTRSMKEFSGGWKMRAVLAGLLFRRPDLLLLDEPTNHLDVPTVEWLDQFLPTLECALVLVSHDREFLDGQVKKILSFEFEGLRLYTGNYTEYLRLRSDEDRLLLSRAKNVEDRKRQAKRFINRFRAKNTKAKQVQSRIKEIAKLKEIDVPKEQKRLKFTFAPTERCGKDVVIIDKLSKAYPDADLFSKLSKTIYRGDRIAVIGINGAGKTTLLKMMAGEVRPDSGKVELGHNVVMGYYAQHQSESLNPDRTILDEVWSVVPDATMTYVRGVCGAFLFTGDDVDKFTGVLSGGEKARVSLARLLLRPGQLLLMDEPTNHLDIWSSEALGEALETYDGTLIFVSHNRAFVNRLANKIWDIKDGEIYEYPGTLDEYLYHLKKKNDDVQPGKKTAVKAVAQPVLNQAGNTKIARKEQRRLEAQRRQEAFRHLSPIENKIVDLEKRIAEIETEYADLETQLANPAVYEDGKKSSALLTRFDAVKNKLEELMSRWEYQQKQAEEIRSRLVEDE